MGEKKVVGENMNELEFAYCNECEDLVKYNISDEIITEQYKGEEVQFRFKVGRCTSCGCEVATDIDYNSRRSEEKIRAYKKKKDLIGLEEISEILDKYNIGKEALAQIAGFGKVTIKRYYDGLIPARKYSDVLFKLLDNEVYFMESVEVHKDKLKEVTYKKIFDRYQRLIEIKNSKIDQIANYIIIHLGEVTPLALEKLLSFSNGVNYALNGKQMIYDESQAWQHGPVYPYIYNKYRNFGYKPIDNGIYSSHGCMLSKLTDDEIKSIDLVIRTFGIYSPKTLEMISHTQTPWIEKRVNYKDNEAGKEIIDEESIKKYYIYHKLNSEENILCYVINSIKKQEV